MNGLISIIVPVYQAEKWLERCLESIINQTYSKLEIILINDGSTDKSADICEFYAKTDSRIEVIHKKNEGPSIARNIGLKKANGEFVQFVDSDDWLDLNASDLLVNNMQNYEVDLVLCGFNITKNNLSIRKPSLPLKKYSVYDDEYLFYELLKILASPCNKLYKKEYIKTFFDEKLSAGEDLKFNVDYLSSTGNVLTIPNSLYNVSLDNESSLNRTFRTDRLDLFLQNKEYLFSFCEDIYNGSYNPTFLHTDTIMGVHAHFREIGKNLNSCETKKIISLYVNNVEVINASKYAAPPRIDYKLFNILVKKKITALIYVYIKTKLKLEMFKQ